MTSRRACLHCSQVDGPISLAWPGGVGRCEVCGTEPIECFPLPGETVERIHRALADKLAADRTPSATGATR